MSRHSFAYLLFARNPRFSIPKEVFLIDDMSRDAEDEAGEAIFITEVAGHDKGTLYQLRPRMRPKAKQPQSEPELQLQEEGLQGQGQGRGGKSRGEEMTLDDEYRLMVTVVDLKGKNLSMRREFVGVLWTPRAREGFNRLMEQLFDEGVIGISSSEEGEGRGTSVRGEEAGGSVAAAGDRMSWAFSAAIEGVKAGFIDPGGEFDLFRERTTQVYY